MKNKTISLPEDLYDKLKRQKKKGESFPDLIDRLIKEKKSRRQQLEALAGSLKEDDEWDNILNEIYEDRKRPARI
jgi:predicted CopG family antitoxin